MKVENVSVRQWLIANNYPEVAAQINEIMEEWKRTGRRTRRNWWEILSGDKNGNPRIVAGRKFPVLRAARLRHNLPVTDNCISQAHENKAPRIVFQERWRKKNND